MSGCGHRECMGHGHYETCGKPGQLGVYECDGCKVKRLEAAIIAIDEAIEIGEGVSPQYYLRAYGFYEHIATIESVLLKK